MKGRTKKIVEINLEDKDFPIAPNYLDQIAKDKWIEICENLHQNGLLSETDRDSIELYCTTYSIYRRLQIESYGQEIITANNGYRQPNPAFIESNKAAKQCEFILRKMGLNPGSRAQLRQEAKRKIDDKWEGII